MLPPYCYYIMASKTVCSKSLPKPEISNYKHQITNNFQKLTKVNVISSQHVVTKGPLRAKPMQTEEKLKKRIAYEKMLAGISEQAVSVCHLKDFLSGSLKSMGSVLDVSRIFIFTYQPVSDTFSCICEWVAEGITTLAALDELMITIPWGAKHLKDGKIINFPDTRDIPGARDRERLLAAEVKSTLNVPLFIKGDLYGFMGFDECRHHRKWMDEDVYILTTAAQIITRAIENKQFEEGEILKSGIK